MNRIPLVWLVAGAEAADLAGPVSDAVPAPHPGEDVGAYATRALVVVGVGLLAELARAGVSWAVAELARGRRRALATRARMERERGDRRQPVGDEAP